LGDLVTSVIVGIGMALVVETPVLRLRDKYFPTRSRALAPSVKDPEIESRQAETRRAMVRVANECGTVSERSAIVGEGGQGKWLEL
jgi:hypothetical protein